MLGLQHDVHRKNFGTSNLGFGDLDRCSGEIVKFFKGSLVRSAVMSSCRLGTPETVPSLYGHADVLLNAPTKYYQES